MAEKNLDIEKQNLYRVTDILAELEKQTGPLFRQSEKAREYLKYRDALKALDIQMYLSEYGRLKAVPPPIKKRQTLPEGIWKPAKKRLKRPGQDNEAPGTRLKNVSGKIDALKMQISEIQLSREKNESEIRILKEQIRSDQSTAGHYEERQRQIQQDIESGGGKRRTGKARRKNWVRRSFPFGASKAGPKTSWTQCPG